MAATLHGSSRDHSLNWLLEQPPLLVDASISSGSSISRRGMSMFAELLVEVQGTQRALLLDMTGTRTIETINGEQIATVTDLLLVRSRAARRRLSSNKAAFAGDVRVLARGSRPAIQVPTVSRDERTLFVRVRRAGTSTTSAAILATMFAIAIVITSLI